MIRFILNRKSIVTEAQPGMTLLDFVRYDQNLKGTKIGCREGDCGACTVLVGKKVNDKVEYRSMTSCLTPLANVAGMHVVTVEGINSEKLNPVQQAIVDEGGTQCGFCTVGFVMSLTGCCVAEKNPSVEKVIASMDGNICRCTGYKSLERAAAHISEHLKRCDDENRLSWLANEKFVPEYFAEISNRLEEVIPSKGKGLITGGGTDLYVQKHDSMVNEDVHAIFNDASLNGISESNNIIYIGGAVTVEDLKNSTVMNAAFPELQKHLKLVSSTPIRNMATLAGNFVNASPIGDMTIFFLALNAEIILNNNGNKRKVLLKDFYQGYKKLDKEKDEIIEQISFSKPISSHFSFEKVSKRTHLDIASVNSALNITISDNKITTIHASMGGVFAFPKYLDKTCASLKGKEINVQSIAGACEILQTEIAPISDARGSESYKRLLARQLFAAHFKSFISESDMLNILSI